MKVRILSGNARGQIVEMSQTEAEVNISTGFAEAFVPVSDPVVVPKESLGRSKREPPTPEE